jgi:hypothetical protein
MRLGRRDQEGIEEVEEVVEEGGGCAGVEGGGG